MQSFCFRASFQASFSGTSLLWKEMSTLRNILSEMNYAAGGGRLPATSMVPLSLLPWQSSAGGSFPSPQAKENASPGELALLPAWGTQLCPHAPRCQVPRHAAALSWSQLVSSGIKRSLGTLRFSKPLQLTSGSQGSQNLPQFMTHFSFKCLFFFSFFFSKDDSVP